MSPIPGDNRQDPHDPNGDDISTAAMETNIIVAAGSSSESAGEEELEDGYQGYQLLPQDAVPEDEDSEEMNTGTADLGATGINHSNITSSLDDTLKNSMDREDFTTSQVPSYLQGHNQTDPSINERKSLWSEARLHPQEPMDQDHLSKIKAAMSGFSLPGCQIPEWAKVVPEEDWKTQLLSRLHGQVPLISSRSTMSSDNQQDSSISQETESSVVSDPPSKRPRCSVEEGEDAVSQDGSGKCQQQTSTDQSTEEEQDER